MMSNLGTRAAPDLQRELARAYDGDVPPPYYWQLPASPPPMLNPLTVTFLPTPVLGLANTPLPAAALSVTESPLTTPTTMPVPVLSMALVFAS